MTHSTRHLVGVLRGISPILHATATEVGVDVQLGDAQERTHAYSGEFTASDQAVDRLAAHAEHRGDLTRTEEPTRRRQNDSQPFLPFLLYEHGCWRGSPWHGRGKGRRPCPSCASLPVVHRPRNPTERQGEGCSGTAGDGGGWQLRSRGPGFDSLQARQRNRARRAACTRPASEHLIAAPATAREGHTPRLPR